MTDTVQRISVYTVKAGVGDEQFRKIAVIDGDDSKADRDLSKFVNGAFSDKTVNKVVLRRTYIPEDQAT